jgi:hypothetical protein
LAVEAAVAIDSVMLSTFGAQHERSVALDGKSAIPLSGGEALLSDRSGIPGLPLVCGLVDRYRGRRGLGVNESTI